MHQQQQQEYHACTIWCCTTNLYVMSSTAEVCCQRLPTYICLIAVWPTFKVDALERVFNGLDPVEGKDAERVVGQIQSFDGRHGMQDFRAKLAQEVAPQVQPDQAGQVSE